MGSPIDAVREFITASSPPIGEHGFLGFWRVLGRFCGLAGNSSRQLEYLAHSKPSSAGIDNPTVQTIPTSEDCDKAPQLPVPGEEVCAARQGSPLCLSPPINGGAFQAQLQRGATGIRGVDREGVPVRPTPNGGEGDC